DPTGRNANFTFTGAPANPGYALTAISSQENYFFSKRGAFRSESRAATDLAINYTFALMGKRQFFARGDILNIFNNQKIVDPSLIDTSVITSRTGDCVTADSEDIEGSSLCCLNDVRNQCRNIGMPITSATLGR
ncbi:MAG: hypothetical protein M3P29_06965, partial [Acidobacteriota bacterium]|nr:hypothetical protein [Acidobacteriota bacterium]